MLIYRLNGNLTVTSGGFSAHLTAASGIHIDGAAAAYNDYMCTIRVQCSKTDGTAFATGRTQTNPLFTIDAEFKSEIPITFPVVTNNSINGVMSNYADAYIAASGNVIVDIPAANTTAKQIQVSVTYMRAR